MRIMSHNVRGLDGKWKESDQTITIEGENLGDNEYGSTRCKKLYKQFMGRLGSIMESKYCY